MDDVRKIDIDILLLQAYKHMILITASTSDNLPINNISPPQRSNDQTNNASVDRFRFEREVYLP